MINRVKASGKSPVGDVDLVPRGTSADFFVQVIQQHGRFGEWAKPGIPALLVVRGLLRLVFRLAAVLDMLSHRGLALDGSFRWVVGARVVGGFLDLALLGIRRSVLRVVNSLQLSLLVIGARRSEAPRHA